MTKMSSKLRFHYDFLTRNSCSTSSGLSNMAPKPGTDKAVELESWKMSKRIRKCHSLQWRHNGRDGVSTHRRLSCLLNLLFRRRSKKTSKLRVTGLGEGNSPVTGEFPTQRATWKMFPFDDVIMSKLQTDKVLKESTFFNQITSSMVRQNTSVNLLR